MIDPAQTQQANSSISDQPQAIGVSGVGGKEVEVGSVTPVEVPAIKEIGHEVPLPSEVVSVGVSQKPTTVQLPASVSQMGVKAVGQATAPPAVVVTLPLTDDQIAQGLHQSIMSSWRWLSEWCIRRLKQVHLGFKTIHGKIMRVKYV